MQTKFMCTYLPYTFQTHHHTFVVQIVILHKTYIYISINKHMFIRPKTMCRRTSRLTYLHVHYTSHLDRNIVRDMRSSTDMNTYEYKSLQTYDHILPTYTFR